MPAKFKCSNTNFQQFIWSVLFVPQSSAELQSFHNLLAVVRWGRKKIKNRIFSLHFRNFLGKWKKFLCDQKNSFYLSECKITDRINEKIFLDSMIFWKNFPGVLFLKRAFLQNKFNNEKYQLKITQPNRPPDYDSGWVCLCLRKIDKTDNFSVVWKRKNEWKNIMK